jgi:hypothetical protein
MRVAEVAEDSDLRPELGNKDARRLNDHVPRE